MLSRHLGVFGLTSTLMLGLAGCGAEPEPVASGVGGPGSSPDGGGAVNTGCPTVATENCSCADGSPGSRTCASGTWTACACGVQSAPVTTLGTCKAGHYEGDFEGTYRSGFILGLGIPVYALDISFGPALTFTLEEMVGGDPEFPSYVISNGQIHGTADFVFPFDAKLTGTLDCRTKTLTGEMDGGYSIVIPAGINQGKFIGPVTGAYDSNTHSFTTGTWKLHEEDSLGISILGDTGGDGIWTAKWVSPP